MEKGKKNNKARKDLLLEGERPEKGGATFSASGKLRANEKTYIVHKIMIV